MRFAISCLTWGASLALASSGPACAAEDGTEAPTVEITRVWTAYRETPSFVRFGALREASSEPGSPQVVRSVPAEYDGYYFTIRVRSAGRKAPLPDGQVRVQVVGPNESTARTFSFPLTGSKRGRAELLVGITGADWTHGDTMPLAWRIEVVSADGARLAIRDSFLWEKPAAAAP